MTWLFEVSKRLLERSRVRVEFVQGVQTSFVAHSKLGLTPQ